jgi:hypothetical protein
VLTYQEKKLPATIQEKQSTPTKKINFAKAALAASKAVDQEKGGTESEMSRDLWGMLAHDRRNFNQMEDHHQIFFYPAGNKRGGSLRFIVRLFI